MRAAIETERCSMCHHELRNLRGTGCGVLKVTERNKEITLVHCPVCGSLLVHVETVTAESR